MFGLHVPREDRHKVVEHTSGEDIQCYYGDNRNWTNSELYAALSFRGTDGRRLPNYQVTLDSWFEQRSYLPNALAALETPAHRAFADTVQSAVRRLRKPVAPNPAGRPGWETLSAGSFGRPLRCGGMELTFDPQTGAAVKIVELPSETPLWSGKLGGFVYQTVDVADYNSYGQKYGPNFTACDVPPLVKDTCQARVQLCGGSSFVKVNMSHANPRHLVQRPSLEAMWFNPAQCSVVTKALFPASLHDAAGAPKAVFTEWQSGPSYVHFEVTWVEKAATKLPEAVWIEFAPDTGGMGTADGPGNGPEFTLESEKLGRWLNTLDVVHRGAVNQFPADAMRVTLLQQSGAARQTVSTTARSTDAAFVGVGPLWPFPTRDSETVEGAPRFQWNLMNNIWGTNYVMWYPFAGEPGHWLDGVNSTFRFDVNFTVLPGTAANLRRPPA